MKRPYAFIILVATVCFSAVHAEEFLSPGTKLRRATLTAFDRSNLKSGTFNYQMIYDGGTSLQPVTTSDVQLVISGDKYYVSEKITPTLHIDSRTIPAVITTNYGYQTRYWWYDGSTLTKGTDEPEVMWEIQKGTNIQHEKSHNFFIENCLLLDHTVTVAHITNYVAHDFVNVEDTPEGQAYHFANPLAKMLVVVNKDDGRGIAPIRDTSFYAKTGQMISDMEWSGWNFQNGVWIPTSYSYESEGNMSHYDHASNQTIETNVIVKKTYTILSAEKINEPIHAKWFMPQLPEDDTPIRDRTGLFPFEENALDLQGVDYTPATPKPEAQPEPDESHAPAREL